MTAPQNILLILTDQHRYDIVGANGSQLCQSPNLDRLAAEGVNFSRAYTVCPLCTPTRASIYTGVAPHRHGLVRNVMANSPDAIIPPTLPTLGERLSGIGYDCRFVGKWHAGNRLPTECGFSGMDIDGYGSPGESDVYHQYLKRNGLTKPDIQPIGGGWAHLMTHAGTMDGPVEASIPYFLADYTLDQLEAVSGGDQPFFMAVNFWGPHAPYLPSEPFASMYDPGDIEPWGNFDDNFTGKPPIYRRYRDAFIGEGRAPRSWEECARWAALYYGFATQIDHQIGRILDGLETAGLADSTAVIFSTDHGDLTGAHGGMHDKNGMLVEELMHIPMITRLTQQTMAGTTCTAHASILDVPATIMELAGQGVPDSFDGRSLLPLMSGETPPADWPDYAAGEFFGNQFGYECQMIVHAGHKYIYHPGAFDELYDLEADPWEMRNLIEEPGCQSIVRDCRRRLLQWLKDTDADLCIACGLFHDREPWSAAATSGYSPSSQDELRRQPTRLIGDV